MTIGTLDLQRRSFKGPKSRGCLVGLVPAVAVVVGVGAAVLSTREGGVTVHGHRIADMTYRIEGLGQVKLLCRDGDGQAALTVKTKPDPGTGLEGSMVQVAIPECTFGGLRRGCRRVCAQVDKQLREPFSEAVRSSLNLLGCECPPKSRK
jgi:hypothetical protein